MGNTRILLVDDHQLFREGVATILNAQPDFDVVGVAGDGLEALVRAEELKPDIVLMDISMPGIDGVETTRMLIRQQPDVVVIMLTVRDENEQLFQALKYGARGYLLKRIDSGELVAMLRASLRGEAAISPALGGRLLEEFQRLSRLDTDAPIAETTLTSREQEVLCLIAQGLSDQEIAAQLVISVHTVKSHVHNILAKLQFRHRYEAAQFAVKQGLIPAQHRQAGAGSATG
jgi:DNA-binding NarL/FixJ family response regulator